MYRSSCRTAYLKRSLQDLQRKAETEVRKRDRLLRVAIDHLGSGGQAITWRTTYLEDFVALLRRLTMVQDILCTEYVYNTWYAHWKMRLWRRKRSVLMQYYAGVFRKVAAPGVPIVFGVGDGGFAASGKGERPVPTSGARAEARRAMRHTRSRNKGITTFVDETCTTMKCSKCGTILRDVKDDAGNVLRGLKVCPGCAKHPTVAADVVFWHQLQPVDPAGIGVGRSLPGGGLVQDVKGCVLSRLKPCTMPKLHDDEHAFRLLNRDANAAKNIWLVLDALIRGLPRPSHLMKSKPPRKGRSVQTRK